MRRWRLVACLCAVLLVSPGFAGASADAAAGLVALRKFPTAIAAVGVGAVGTDSVTVVATKGAGLYAMGAGSTSFRKLTPVLDVMTVTSIAVLGEDRWLVGTDGNGLWQTTNAGSSFTPVETLDCPRIARIVVDSADARRIFVASLCTGLHYSTDGGATWSDAGAGIASKQVTDVVRLDAARVVAAIAPDGTPGASGLFLSTDNGKFYAAMKCPLARVGSVAWAGGSKTLYAAAGDRIVATSDMGAHWSDLAAAGTVSGLAVTPSGWLLAATAQRGLTAWDAADSAWLAVAGGDGVASATCVAVGGTWLVAGGADGTVLRAGLDHALAAGTTSVTLGSIPANQRRQGGVTLANIGGGTMAFQVAGTSAYLTASPASGWAASRMAVVLTVDGTQVDPGSYERLVKVTTGGGDLPVTVAFSVGASQPVVIRLTIGKSTASVGTDSVALDAAPYIDKASGRTMVPVRFIAEAFGATVRWDAGLRRVTIEAAATAGHRALLLVMTVGSRKATVNGAAVTLEVAPAIMAGRTFVPLRVVSELMGAQVQWNAAARSVAIEYVP